MFPLRYVTEQKTFKIPIFPLMIKRIPQMAQSKADNYDRKVKTHKDKTALLIPDNNQ